MHELCAKRKLCIMPKGTFRHIYEYAASLLRNLSITIGNQQSKQTKSNHLGHINRVGHITWPRYHVKSKVLKQELDSRLTWQREMPPGPQQDNCEPKNHDFFRAKGPVWHQLQYFMRVTVRQPATAPSNWYNMVV